MEKPLPPTGTCKLCGETCVLQWSHILPRWIYRRLIKGNPPGFPTSPVKVQNSSAVASPKQEAEYLLCRSCEEMFGIYEKYLSSISLQVDNNFPAMAQTRVIQIDSRLGLKVGDASNLDVEKIVRFAASVIWRASISTIFPGTTLGAKYNQEFANYLLKKTQFPIQACLLVDLINPKNIPQVDWVVVYPGSKKNGPYHCHQFHVFGIWFRLFVAGQFPASLTKFSFLEKKRVLISDGVRLLNFVEPVVKQASLKGRLA